MSKGKARAETERKKGEMGKANEKEQIMMTEKKIGDGREVLSMRSNESTHNIDCIISQMREILN